MEIEFTKPTPKAAGLQSLFNQTDKETISLLMKEVEELHAKLEAWQKCADNLFEYADEVKCGTGNEALWRAACRDVEKYKELKNERESNE